MSKTREQIDLKEIGWQPISTAPEHEIVETMICDSKGARNVQPLKLAGDLWFLPSGGMYVYYVPTHWRKIK